MDKFLSRKFLVTLGSLVAVLFDSGLGPLQLGVMGLVAVTYVVAETVLDRRSVEIVARSIEDGVQLGRDFGGRLGQLEEHAAEHTHHTGLGPTSPASVPQETQETPSR